MTPNGHESRAKKLLRENTRRRGSVAVVVGRAGAWRKTRSAGGAALPSNSSGRQFANGSSEGDFAKAQESQSVEAVQNPVQQPDGMRRDGSHQSLSAENKLFGRGVRAMAITRKMTRWTGAESNHRHQDFQSCAQPSRLNGRQIRPFSSSWRIQGMTSSRAVSSDVSARKPSTRSALLTSGTRCCTSYVNGSSDS
jgi:hypothetical protein